MNDLPQRYTALVARRPELAIPSEVAPHDIKLEPLAGGGWAWVHYVTGSGPILTQYVTPREAESLIFRRLCEMLPHARALVRMFDKWAIATVIVGSSGETSDWHHDPLSALFAFWESQP